MKDAVQTQSAVLPHQSDSVFVIDGGLETTLIFHDGIDLPHFAAFTVIETPEGRDAMRRYFEGYLRIAQSHGAGMIFETPTWRASADWGKLLGYDAAALAEVNKAAVAMIREFSAKAARDGTPVVLSGCIGPRGDGYTVGDEMTVEEARKYHTAQVQALAEGGVQMITGLTMTYTNEAIGIVQAAKAAGVEAVVSFTVETDGRLPSGQALGEAIEQVDRETGSAPIYFMINCAHPTHFEDALKVDAPWLKRIGGVRANASRLSHAELDEAEELDDGNPVEFGREHLALRALVPSIRVMGGCCGTDHRHVDAIHHSHAVAH